MKSDAKTRSGTSIVELSVAISCLAVLIASVSALCVSAARCSRQVSEEAAALSAARGLLADVAANDATRAHGEIALEIPDGSARMLQGAKARAVFEPWADGLSKVTVDLAWKGTRGAYRSITLVSLVNTGGAR